MADDPLQIAVIVGSVRAGRIAPVVASWLMTQLAQHEQIGIEMIDLADLSLPDSLDGGGDASGFAKRVDAADGFIVVTPEYNHGYPGALKTAIDTARDEWRAKAVGFVSYGGTAGGLRAVEQLRLVFAELHATAIRDVVSLHRVDDLFDGNGNPRDPGASAAMRTMVSQLCWWAGALRKARTESQDHV
jgi:NAD(P)H-dependent FMN reductase